MVDYVSQKLYLVMEQLTFGQSELHTVLPEARRNFLQVFQVCSKIWGEENNIIKVYQQRLLFGH